MADWLTDWGLWIADSLRIRIGNPQSIRDPHSAIDNQSAIRIPQSSMISLF
jgi:hypothetical protein